MDTHAQLSNPNVVALNDLEGLLVDTEFPKRLAFLEVFREFYGLEMTVPELAWTLGLQRQNVISGLTERFESKPLMPDIARDQSISIGEQILRRRDEIVKAHFDSGIELMPGAELLIETCALQNLASLVITSTAREVAMQMMRAAQIPDEFDAAVFGDTAGLLRGKPHPDPFLMGAARVGAAPECCIVLGDSSADIFAAREAKMSSIYVPDRRIIAPNPEAVQAATYVVEDLFQAAAIVQDEVRKRG